MNNNGVLLRAIQTGLTLLVCIAAWQTVQAGEIINGAGATFPYPLYGAWAHKYEQLTGVRLNYQSIGSGGGVRQIRARTVHFGASDGVLTPKELNADGLLQFPLTVGGVVPIVNVPGIAPGQLKLSADALANIYLGKIKKWSDPALKELNSGLDLPDKAIVVVRRADGSGTTFLFSNYLSKVSTEWKDKVGAGMALSWPVGIGGKGNEGVAAFVRQVECSIGYVEFAYALENKLAYIQLKNRAGRFVMPTIESFQAAVANADWANTPAFGVVPTDQPGDESWPITGASFILIHKKQRDCNVASAMLKFFDWCLRHGQDIAIEKHYVPIPENVVELIEAAWRKEIRCGGKPVW